MAEPVWSAITRWAPVLGRWNITTTEVEFLGQPVGPQPLVGICASDVEMNEGTVKVHATLTSVGDREDSAARILFGFRSPDSRYLSVGIGGYSAAFVLSEFLPTVGWRAISAVGLRQNLSTDHPYELIAQFLGQRVTLKVDGVRVIESVLDAPIQRGQVGLFCWGTASVKFSRAEVLREPGSAFVVMHSPSHTNNFTSRS